MIVDENTSDGYHTFRELYDHRVALFVALMKSHPDISWVTPSRAEGWLLAGMNLPTGDITYHLPISVTQSLAGVPVYDHPVPFDGHTSADVVDRLTRWCPL